MIVITGKDENTENTGLDQYTLEDGIHKVRPWQMT